MSSHTKWANNLSYVLKLGLIYSLTLAFAWYCVRPVHQTIVITEQAKAKASYSSYNDQLANYISGQPVRIVIPQSAIDIPIDPGNFDQATDTWTLSGYRAEFDTASAVANNGSGDTFIYGHNNDFVFGSLRHNTPKSGAVAYVYTANGHIFEYSFSTAYSVGPTDTAVLEENGPPIMTVQTCTGSLNEWRTMYVFSLDKVLS